MKGVDTMANFKAEQFTPTKFSTAADKAKFANHFVKFLEDGCRREAFHKWFYRRLSMTFGHIAHYDIHGFYDVWFSSHERQQAFIRRTMLWECYGSPKHTYSDVEGAIIVWITERMGVA